MLLVGSSRPSAASRARFFDVALPWSGWNTTRLGVLLWELELVWVSWTLGRVQGQLAGIVSHGVVSECLGLVDIELDCVTQNLRRLEAQRNALNARVRLLREELQLLHEPASYVGEVVKVMGKKKVSVKVQPEESTSSTLTLTLTLRPSRRHGGSLHSALRISASEG
ncbi:hypothetical protein OG21DRAFT_1483846 [Imleria badia]|nr:hypothetical protein OG21DRAFT_1483846 [Imleria badia]